MVRTSGQLPLGHPPGIESEGRVHRHAYRTQDRDQVRNLARLSLKSRETVSPKRPRASERSPDTSATEESSEYD